VSGQKRWNKNNLLAVMLKQECFFHIALCFLLSAIVALRVDLLQNYLHIEICVFFMQGTSFKIIWTICKN